MGRMTDIVIVSSAGLRFAHRRGLVSDDLAKKFGAADSKGGAGLSAAELAVIGAAMFRLLGRARNRGRSRG